jgi:hypothetical protein
MCHVLHPGGDICLLLLSPPDAANDFSPEFCSFELLSRLFLAQLILWILMMEAIYSSETLVDTQRTTRHYTPEDGTLHNHRCENLKSYIA